MTTEAQLPRLCRRRRWVVRMLLIMGSLLAMELVLQLSCLMSTTLSQALAPWRASSIPDERLGMRGDPTYPGHDARGFRNPQALETAEIVAIGDSQTYGTSVEPDETWPRELERLSGRKVYSLAFGGWDPVRYRIALTDALALKPKLVIVGVYPGNDMYGAFRSCYGTTLAPELRDPAEALEIERLERIAPLDSGMSELRERVAGYRESANWRQTVRTISEWIKLAALCRAIRVHYVAWQHSRWEFQQQLASASQQELSVFDTPTARTILTSNYRVQGMNLDDARIAAGLKVTERALADMNRQCHQADCKFLVVLIPVKEYVFAPLVDNPERHVGLVELCRHQRSAIEQLSKFLRQENIEVLDTAPALEATLTRNGENPYLASTDGHPSPAGHRALAQELMRHGIMSP